MNIMCIHLYFTLFYVIVYCVYINNNEPKRYKIKNCNKMLIYTPNSSFTMQVRNSKVTYNTQLVTS